MSTRTTVVKKGQVLARLDLARLKDAVTKSRANLASADAQVLQAAATVAETRAKLERMKRVAELSGGKVPSQASWTVRARRTSVPGERNQRPRGGRSRRAPLQSDETNLGKAHDPLADRRRGAGAQDTGRPDGCSVLPGTGAVHAGRRI
jgi:HlyD family secretion protein